MSIINQVNKQAKNLPDILDQYRLDSKQVQKDLALTGKTLRQAITEQASFQQYYGQKVDQLKILYESYELRTNKVKSELFKKFKENHNRDLTDREINQYIVSEPTYINMYQISLEIKEILLQYQNVAKAFESRGYGLNNLTKACVAQVENFCL